MKRKLSNIFSIFLAVIIFSTAVFAQSEALNGNWDLVELKHDGNSIAVAGVKGRGGKKLGADFTDIGRFGLKSSCNAMGGQYVAETDGNFKASGIFGTKMFCGDDSMKIENALAGAMQAATAFVIDSDVLILKDESGANLLRFTRAEKITETTETKEMTLYVAAKQSKCTSVASMKCLLTKETADGEWRLFYNKIEGFDFQKGYHYILKVERTKLKNPPQDTSAYRYKLIKVVKKSKKFVSA